MNPKSQKNVQSLDDFANGATNGTTDNGKPKRVGDQDKFALGAPDSDSTNGTAVSLEDFVNQSVGETKKKSGDGVGPSVSDAGNGASASNGEPDQQQPPLPDQFTQVPKIPGQPAKAPESVTVDGKSYDLASLPVGIFQKPEEFQKLQKELAGRINDNHISESDATTLSPLLSLHPKDARTAINAPTAYDFQKSYSSVDQDITNNLPSVAKDLQKAGIDPAQAKNVIMKGGQEMDKYVGIRQKQLNAQLDDINKQLEGVTEEKTVSLPFSHNPTSYTVVKDQRTYQQLKDQQQAVKDQLDQLNHSAINIKNLQLNKQFDGPDPITGNPPAKFDNKYAEANGSVIKKIYSPVEAEYDQMRQNQGYALPDQTKFANAQIGMAGRLKVMDAQVELARQNALDEYDKLSAPLNQRADELKKQRSVIDQQEQQLQDLKKAGKIEQYNAMLGPLNNMVKKYQEQADILNKTKIDGPAQQKYQQTIDSYKNLSDQYNKLSDNYPEVRREELTRAMLDLLHAKYQSDQKVRAATMNAGTAVGAGDVLNFLQDMMGKSLTPEDVKALSKETGVPEDKIWDLDFKGKRFIGGGLDQTGLVPDAINSTYAYGKSFQATGNRIFGDRSPIATDVLNEKIDRDIANSTRQPDENNLYQLPDRIDLKKNSPTYLRSVANEKAGDLNLNMGSFIHNVADNAAQFALFAAAGFATGKVIGLGADALGAALSPTYASFDAALGTSEGMYSKNALVRGTEKAGEFLARSKYVDRAAEIAGIYGSSFAMGYDNYYKEAGQFTNDETKKHLYAINMANWDAMGEIILPETDIVRAMQGKKNMFKMFEKILAEDGGGWTSSKTKQFGVAALKGLAIANKEGLEEVFTAVGQGVTKPLFTGQPIDWSAIAQDAKQSYVSIVLGMLPNAVGASVGSAYQMKKEALYEAGNEPGRYSDAVQRLADKGKITQQEANRRVQTINTMADIIKHLPTHDQHGDPYSAEQKVEIAAQEYRIRKNKDIADGSAPVAQKAMAEEDTKDAVAAQDQELKKSKMQDMFDNLSKLGQTLYHLPMNIYNQVKGKSRKAATEEDAEDDEQKLPENVEDLEEVQHEKNYFTNPENLKRDYVKERAPKQLELLEKDPVKYFEDERDDKDENGDFFYDEEHRAYLQNTIDKIKEIQKRKSPATKAMQDALGVDDEGKPNRQSDDDVRQQLFNHGFGESEVENMGSDEERQRVLKTLNDHYKAKQKQKEDDDNINIPVIAEPADSELEELNTADTLPDDISSSKTDNNGKRKEEGQEDVLGPDTGNKQGADQPAPSNVGDKDDTVLLKRTDGTDVTYNYVQSIEKNYGRPINRPEIQRRLKIGFQQATTILDAYTKEKAKREAPQKAAPQGKHSEKELQKLADDYKGRFIITDPSHSSDGSSVRVQDQQNGKTVKTGEAKTIEELRSKIDEHIEKFPDEKGESPIRKTKVEPGTAGDRITRYGDPSKQMGLSVMELNEISDDQMQKLRVDQAPYEHEIEEIKKDLANLKGNDTKEGKERKKQLNEQLKNVTARLEEAELELNEDWYKYQLQFREHIFKIAKEKGLAALDDDQLNELGDEIMMGIYEPWGRESNWKRSVSFVIDRGIEQWMEDEEQEAENANISNLTGNEEKELNELLKGDGVTVKDILPHKEVKVNHDIAIHEIAQQFNLTDMEGKLIYDIKSHPIDGAILPELHEDIYNKLEKKGFIDDDDNLTDKGKDFVAKVDSRYATRKGVHEGTDLFGETAAIPEYNKAAEEEKDTEPAKVSQDVDVPELDATYYVDPVIHSNAKARGYNYQLRVDFAKSVGDENNWMTAELYRDIPTMAQVKKNILDVYEHQQAELAKIKWVGPNPSPQQKLLTAINKVLDNVQTTQGISDTGTNAKANTGGQSQTTPVSQDVRQPEHEQKTGTGANIQSKGKNSTTKSNTGTTGSVKSHTWKIGEYAKGGIITAEVKLTPAGTQIDIIGKEWDHSAGDTRKSNQSKAKEFTRKTFVLRNNDWQRQQENEMSDFLNDLTSSHYAGEVLKWIKSQAEPKSDFVKDHIHVVRPAGTEKTKGEALDEELDNALDDFFKAIKKGDTLGFGANFTEVLETGVKLINVYVKRGMYKFSEMVRTMIDKRRDMFDNPDVIKGMQAAYGAHRSANKEDRSRMETDDQVDDFIEKEYPGLLQKAKEVADYEHRSDKEHADMMKRQFKAVWGKYLSPEQQEATISVVEAIGKNRLGSAEKGWRMIEGFGEGKFQEGAPVLFQNGVGISVAPEIVDGFYSPIEKKIGEAKANNYSATKWKEILGKGEEVKFTGMLAFLDNKKPDQQVKKEELLHYIKNNRIQLLEVVHTDSELSTHLRELEKKHDEARTKMASIARKLGSEHEPYVSGLPLRWVYKKTETAVYERAGLDVFKQTYKGHNIEGEDYLIDGKAHALPAEVLKLIDQYNEGFTPYTMEDVPEKYIQELDELQDVRNDYNSAVSETEDEFTRVDGPGTKYSKYQVEGEKENYKEVVIALPEEAKSQGALAVNNFVDTMKSKYGDKWRSQITPEEEAQRQQLEVNLRNEERKVPFKSDHWKEKNPLVHLRLNTRIDSDGKKVLFLEEVQSDWGRYMRAYKDELGDDLPMQPAPFVNDTPQWVKLGLKYALREAVAQGADSIAWTTGQEQSERYDLSKQVDKINYKKNEDGTYDIVAVRRSESVLNQYNVKESDLDGIVGKDVAGKIIRSEGNQPTGAKLYTELTGEDLKVGGKGMKAFYGEPGEGKTGIIGNVARALVKELTGKEGNIGTTEIENSVKHSIAITPELKAAVERGMPLFQKNGEVKKGAAEMLANGRKIIHALQAPDFSTAIHEIAHVFEDILTDAEKGTILRWSKQKEWNTDASEAWARGFERYLHDGEAPTPELQSLFEKAKQWLKRIYNKLKGSEIERDLTPEVKRVFNSLFVARDESFPDMGELESIGDALRKRFGVDFEVITPEQAAKLLRTKDAKKFFFQILDDIDVFDNKDPRAARAFILKVFQTVDNEKDALRAYRKLSMKYHPDRSGSLEIMQYLNDVNDKYRQGKIGQYRNDTSYTNTEQQNGNYDKWKEEWQKQQQKYEQQNNRQRSEAEEEYRRTAERQKRERDEMNRRHEHANKVRREAFDAWTKALREAGDKKDAAYKAAREKMQYTQARLRAERDEKLKGAKHSYAEMSKINAEWAELDRQASGQYVADLHAADAAQATAYQQASSAREAAFNSVKLQYSADGIPAGFYDADQNKAYFVAGVADETTPIHEAFSHPFIAAAEQENPELYQKLLHAAAADNDIRNWVDEKYGDFNEKTREHEYIARAIDLEARKRLQNKRLIDVIKEFWQGVSNFVHQLFHGETKTVAEINGRTSIGDLVDFVFYSGDKLELATPDQRLMREGQKAVRDAKEIRDKSVSTNTHLWAQEASLETELASLKSGKYPNGKNINREETRNDIRAKIDQIHKLIPTVKTYKLNLDEQDHIVDRLMDSFEGKKTFNIDPDEIRENLRGFGFNGRNAAEFNHDMERITTTLFGKLMDKYTGTSIAFVVGNPGAGKTSTRNQAAHSGAQITWDGVFSDSDKLSNFVGEALDNKVVPSISFVYNTPLNSFINTVKRILNKEENRVVKLDYFLRAYALQQGRLADQQELWASELAAGDVKISAYDNSANNSQPEETDLKTAAAWDYSISHGDLQKMIDYVNQHEGLTEGQRRAILGSYYTAGKEEGNNADRDNRTDMAATDAGSKSGVEGSEDASSGERPAGDSGLNTNQQDGKVSNSTNSENQTDSGSQSVRTHGNDATATDQRDATGTSDTGNAGANNTGGAKSGGSVPGENGRPGSSKTNTGTNGQGGSVAGDNGDIRTEQGLTHTQQEEQQEQHGDNGEYNANNYHLPDDYEAPRTFNKTQRIKDNLEALKVLRTLQQETRRPTKAEQDTLAKYVGWGGIKEVRLNPYDNNLWETDTAIRLRPFVKEIHDLVKELDPDGKLHYLESIDRSAANAHYTSFPVIKGMWNAIKHLGLMRGHLLEPASGIGNFYAAMPRDISARSLLTAIEKDELTGRIFDYLYPDARIAIRGLEDTKLQPDSYDLVMSNIPFGEIPIHDAAFKKNRDKRYAIAAKMVHNYYFIKNLEHVRPGGIIAFITGMGTLDSTAMKPVRELMAEQAEFLGAVRLPNNAFKANANTEVVTDIIFLRKYELNEQPNKKQLFINSSEKALKSRDNSETLNDFVNEYYHAHPDMMIGKAVWGNHLRFGQGFDLDPLSDNVDLEKEITDRLKKVLPKNIFINRQVDKTKEAFDKAQKYVRKGEFNKVGNLVVFADGSVGVVTGTTGIDEELDERARQAGLNPTLIREHRLSFYEEQKLQEIGLSYDDFDIKQVEMTPSNWGQANREKAPHLIGVRNVAMQLINAELQDMDEGYINELRADLNRQYDAFVSRFGLLSSAGNKQLMAKEVDEYTLKALEKQDPKTKQWSKADIFTKRTINQNKKIEKAESIHDAMSVSQQELGLISLDRMGELLGKTPEEIMAEVNKDEKPLIFKTPSDTYVPADEYLTGDVRTKLDEAKEALAGDPDMERNVKALEEVIPPDVPALDIYSPMHSRWIQTRFLRQFINDEMGTDASVTYDESADKIAVELDQDTDRSNQYATQYRGAAWILEHAMNDTEPRVVRTVNGEKIFEEADTVIAKANVARLQMAWDDFKFKDAERRNWLVRTFNDLFNRVKLRVFDGSHLTFPGLMNYVLNPHQKHAIWKILQTGGGLIDHIVGAGKTLVMICAAMEGRRLGLYKKPMIIGLKSQVPQMNEDFKKAYPMAKVLFPRESDFETGNRKRLLSQIATNDWDCIILSHQQFGMLLQNAEIAEEVVEDMVQHLRDLKAEETDQRKITQLNNRIEKALAKARELREAARDTDVLRFDELGVDFLQVDESQEFKNLEYSTRYNNVRGLGPQEGSKRAFNLLLAARWLQKLHGADKGVVMASGTPIANSLAELYHLFRYLNPSGLKARGMRTFDMWASTFAQATTSSEYYMNRWKSITRFRRFANGSELIKWLRSIADVRNDHNITPPLKKPKRALQLEKIVPTKLQNRYMRKLLAFVESKGNAFKEELGLTNGFDEHRGMNPAYAAMAVTFGKKVAMDPRLIDPKNAPGTKIALAADKIADYYQRSSHFKGTQLVFSDIGTPKSPNKVDNIMEFLHSVDTPVADMEEIFGAKYVAQEDEAKPPSWKDVKPRLMKVLDVDAETAELMLNEASEVPRFNVYDDLKKELVARGIPAGEIEYIHNYNTRTQRLDLYKKVNDGDIRILLGSTVKMGVGVNVQKRVIALHHLDMPWRPADVEQREGRAVRQGNDFAASEWGNKVDVHYYATQQSLDAFVYNLVGQKGDTINKIKTDDLNVRFIDDSDAEPSPSQWAAILSGDPLFQRREDLQQQVNNLDALRRGYMGRKFAAEDNLRTAEKQLEGTTKRLAEFRKIKELFDRNIEHTERDPQKENDLEVSIQAMKDRRRKILETKEAQRESNWHEELTNLNQDVQKQEDKLQDIQEGTKFAAEIDGETYDTVGKAGQALNQYITHAMHHAQVEKWMQAGTIWGFDIKIMITEAPAGKKYTTEVTAASGKKHHFYASMNIQTPDGIKIVMGDTVSGYSDVGLGRQIKDQFFKIDQNISSRERQLPLIERDMELYKNQSKDDFPQSEKLAALQKELAEVNEQIDVNTREAEARRQAGEAEEDENDDDDEETKGSDTGDQGGDQPRGGRTPGQAVRRFKIRYGPNAYSNILAIPVALWNSAVEVVALAVDAGDAIGDALRKGYDHIRSQMGKKEWAKKSYNGEMLRALKARGTFKYNLSAKQMAEGDKVIRNVTKGASLAGQMMKVQEEYDKARNALIQKGATAAEVTALDDSYREFENYIMDNIASQYYESLDTRVDLSLKKQTAFQKVKQALQNRYQRPEQLQKIITQSGLTIEEKNDMVNRADRWRSISEARANRELAKIGLSDTDLFIWKGLQKVKDSLFDRMAKAGVHLDDYTDKDGNQQPGFNSYLYALHAPERNRHVADLRRRNFSQRLATLQKAVQDAQDEYNMHSTPTNRSTLTRAQNVLNVYEEYEKAYNDPNGNKNYVRMLEAQIPKRYWLMNDGGSGMTDAEAAEIIDRVTDAGNKDIYDEYEREVREHVINRALDLQKEYGLIAPDDHAFMKYDYYKHYVPLRVDEDYFEDEAGFGENKIPSAKILKVKGADYIKQEHRVSPLTQAIINLQAVIYAGEQNKYMQTVAELVRTAPDDKVWSLEPARYDVQRDKYGRLVGLKELKQPDQSVSFYEEGQKKYILFKDKALYKAIDEAEVSRAIPVLAQINTFFRGFATLYNPNFTVSNLLRDLQAAGIVLGAKEEKALRKNFYRNIPKVFAIIHGSFRASGDVADQRPDAEKKYWEKLAKDFEENGGNMSWFRPEATTDIIANISKAFKQYQNPKFYRNSFLDGKRLAFGLAELMNRTNNAIEQSTRLNIYDAALKSGVPKHKAVELARNATINFNKKGNWGSLMDSLWLFMNANIQGTANVLKTTVMTKRGRWLGGGLIAAGLLQSFMDNFLSDCSDSTHPEDCYDNEPQYVKNRYIVIKIPGTHGFMKISASYGFNVFYDFGETIGQWLQGKTTIAEAATNTLLNALDNFSPLGSGSSPLLQDISPTVTDPIVQWYTNQDGLGRKIYNDYQYDHRPDSEKGFGADSKSAKDLSRWLNSQSGGNEKISGKIDVAPGTLDWIMETMFTGVGQFMKQTATTASGATDFFQKWSDTGERPGFDVEPRDMPIVSRFWDMPKEHSNRGAIYEQLDNSYNNILSPEQLDTWTKELDKAEKLNEIDSDKAEDYRRKMERNQYMLQDQDAADMIDRSKTEHLQQREIDAFVRRIEQAVKAGDLPSTAVKSYKAEITKNQNQLTKQEKE
jgi:N12 class adenine-specific DNA methylase